MTVANLLNIPEQPSQSECFYKTWKYLNKWKSESRGLKLVAFRFS